MSNKGPMPIFKTIDDYIDQQVPEAKPLLRQIRDLIKDTIPEAQELEGIKVPSFMLVSGKKPAQQIMFVAYPKFISFYPFENTVQNFANELKGYELGKGTVKLPYNQNLPIELLKRMIIFRKNELSH